MTADHLLQVPSRARRFVGATLLFALAGCTATQAVHYQIDVARKDVTLAKASGAEWCAPRELALAEAHLMFAETDLAQGELSSAKSHIAIAGPNARAAKRLSPEQLCKDGPRPGDRDGDGIIDRLDRCPDEPETFNGVDDEDGCPDDPDRDGDRIPDSRDACPLEPEDKDGFADDDGCPDPDNDLDGVPDGRDACPNEPEDLDGFQDEDGCPDPDNDGDGVADADDLCPMTAGAPDGPRPGCPDPNALAVMTATEIRITQQVHFATGRAAITAGSRPVLDAVAKVLTAKPALSVEVQGHTDNVGSQAGNLRLSEARAQAVKRYLESKGIAPERLTAKGYGMERPLLPNNSAENRAQNRRVQFVRTDAAKAP